MVPKADLIITQQCIFFHVKALLPLHDVKDFGPKFFTLLHNQPITAFDQPNIKKKPLIYGGEDIK
jgi:hypothetical protein